MKNTIILYIHKDNMCGGGIKTQESVHILHYGIMLVHIHFMSSFC